MATRSPPNRNMWWAGLILDALEEHAVARVVVSPGSRSAPLALLAASRAALGARVVLDERVAGYFAVGHAKATGRPAAVLTTSATAVANLLPACIEADESSTPLVLLTADRPPWLRGVGANQAIDQTGIFGRHVRAAVDLGMPEVSRESRDELHGVLATLLGEAEHGPVHLNVPFDEPVDPRIVPQDAAAIADAGTRHPPTPTRPGISSTRPATAPLRPATESLAQALQKGRALIVVGPWRPNASQRETLLRFASSTGTPILADPLSGLRYGPPGDACVVSTYDAFLRSRLSKGCAPGAILRLGGAPTSKVLLEWMQAQPCPKFLLRPDGRARHHGIPSTQVVAGDEASVMHALSATLANPEPEAPWTGLWSSMDDAARAALAATPEGGASVARTVAGALPEDGVWWLGSSLPVRDADLFVPAMGKRIDVLANRGASGIDGVVSAAAGAAAARPDRRAVVVVGDLSLQHDIGALAAVQAHAPHLTVVCVNNGGGQIFRHLPVAGATTPELLEKVLLTPQPFDIAHAAAAFGVPHMRVHASGSGGSGLTRSLAKPGGLLEVVVDGAAEAAARRAAIDQCVQRLDAGALPR